MPLPQDMSDSAGLRALAGSELDRKGGFTGFREPTLLPNTVLVQFWAHRDLRLSLIGGLIVCICDVKGGRR